MLSSMFGRWPLAEFKSLAPEVQQAFWQESASDKAGLKKSCGEDARPCDGGEPTSTGGRAVLAFERMGEDGL